MLAVVEVEFIHQKQQEQPLLVEQEELVEHQIKTLLVVMEALTLVVVEVVQVQLHQDLLLLVVMVDQEL
tara:strand:- start:68 stop:274 length:207 start_codon:yes stop_codon:yes gene_type:complete